MSLKQTVTCEEALINLSVETDIYLFIFNDGETKQPVFVPRPAVRLSPRSRCRVCSGCGSGPHEARPAGRP